jgi:hypothetical protein
VVWATVLVLAVATAALHLDTRRMREQRLAVEASEMRRQQDTLQRSLATRAERSPAHVRMDELASLRFVSWPAALRALESVPRDDIELASIRVDAKARLIEVEGRAPDGAAVVAYTLNLNAGVPADVRDGRWDVLSVDSLDASRQRQVSFVLRSELGR